VADTTPEKDLRIKGPLHGRHGVPEYRVVDMMGLSLHIHQNPSPEGSQAIREMHLPLILAPRWFPQHMIDFSVAFALS
jgi:hypothetical protein